jgi:hypothetical protein
LSKKVHELQNQSYERRTPHECNCSAKLHEAQQQVLLLQEKVVKMMDQCQESLDLLMAEKDEKAKLRMKLQQLQAENSI